MGGRRQHAALIVAGAGRVELRIVPTLDPGVHGLLIRIDKAGICGTDLEILRRRREDPASILGHEGIGTVEEAGREVRGFRAGDRVVFNPVNPFDQRDILGHSREGLFQEFLTVAGEVLRFGSVLPVAADLPAILGPLVEPLGTVLYGHELVGRRGPVQTVCVVGGGPIGLLHAIYARLRGCRVFLVHTSRPRLDWAVARGIIQRDEALLDGARLAELIRARTGGAGADSVYLCTTRLGAREALKRALEYLRDDGCIDLVGGFADGDCIPELPSLDLNQIRRANVCGIPADGGLTPIRISGGKRLWLTGHRGTSTAHLNCAVALLASRPASFAKVISHVVSLRRAPEILSSLSVGSRRLDGDEVTKVVIDIGWDGGVRRFSHEELGAGRSGHSPEPTRAGSTAILPT